MNNTTKTTQELREAIEQAVSDIHFCSNTEDACSKESHTKLILSLIAKHEAELVENIVDKFITASLEALDETNGEFINYDKLLAEKFAKVAVKLTALTKKESKE